MNTQKPSIGRIVHYHSSNATMAALITGLNEDGTVSLAVWWKDGTTMPDNYQEIPFSEQPTPGHWSWPPRV